MNIIKWLDEHLEEALLIILLLVIACVCLVQVIIRNIPWIPSLKWAEEFCRFCWIWSVFLSLPYTIRKGSMLRVSVLMELLPRKLRKALDLVVDLVVALSMGLLAVCSVGVVRSIYESAETSPAMVWPMWIVYGVMLLGYVLGTFRALQMVVIHAVQFGKNDLSVADAEEDSPADECAEGGGA